MDDDDPVLAAFLAGALLGLSIGLLMVGMALTREPGAVIAGVAGAVFACVVLAWTLRK